jgi:UPF0755 protein
MSKKKIISILIVLIVLLVAFLGINFYNKIYKPNVVEEGFIYLKTNSNFDNLKSKIAPFLKNVESFNWVAEKKQFKTPKSGKYQIDKNMSNNALVNLLRSGKQTPIKLSFNNQNTLESLAGRIAIQIEADSISLLNAFKNKNFLKKIDYTESQSLGIYIPNSYQLYWNTTAEKFRDKMFNEYKKFWNTKRVSKAKALNLSKKEVMTVASIVQKETAKATERPVVAGLYLNRIRDKWPLESDPTIIYAMKQKYGQDLEIRRVLFKNIRDVIESPYNTYKKRGIPPSLIAMPDISSIDAVLNPKNHEYFFMCASVTNIGYHEFAKTLSQHNVNRRKFIAKKNKQGIYQ